MRVCQFRHFGFELSDNDSRANVSLALLGFVARLAYFCLAGDAACDAAGEAAGALTGAVVGIVVAGDGCGAGVGVASGAVVCKTECEPVTPGSESVNAKSIKPAAAPIVIFDKILAVPRGPNAVLDTLLENRSPAPDLPGCNSTTITRTMHDRINSPYKV